MPGGGRRSHEFPYGKPLLLSLTEMAFVGLFALVLALTVPIYGFEGWRGMSPAFAVLIAYGVTKSLLLMRYERIGKAIPINRTSVVVKFPLGFPKPMLAARLAFFVVVAFMLLFGIGPFTFEVATRGIIGCVFGLIAVAAVNLLLEQHYVRVQRATEIEYTIRRDT